MSLTRHRQFGPSQKHGDEGTAATSPPFGTLFPHCCFLALEHLDRHVVNTDVIRRWQGLQPTNILTRQASLSLYIVDASALESGIASGGSRVTRYLPRHPGLRYCMSQCCCPDQASMVCGFPSSWDGRGHVSPSLVCLGTPRSTIVGKEETRAVYTPYWTRLPCSSHAKYRPHPSQPISSPPQRQRVVQMDSRRSLI